MDGGTQYYVFVVVKAILTMLAIYLGFYLYPKNDHIAGILCFPQKMLTTWNLSSFSCRFSLRKFHFYFELLFLPKMCKMLSVQHVSHPQHTFTKYYMWQVFNRISVSRVGKFTDELQEWVNFLLKYALFYKSSFIRSFSQCQAQISDSICL